MTLEYVQDIISKVRRMFSHGKYKDVVTKAATVEFCEIADGIELSSIKFSYFDSIVVTSTGITAFPEHGQSGKIIEFKNFDEFLAM